MFSPRGTLVRRWQGKSRWMNGAVRDEFQGSSTLQCTVSPLWISVFERSLGPVGTFDAAKGRGTLRRGNVRDFERLLGARTIEVWNCATNSGASRK